MKTKQMKHWAGKFGCEYTKRNTRTLEELDQIYISSYGVSRKIINQEFLNRLPKEAKILEVGCNIGLQLKLLEKMGFQNLYGIEINDFAIQSSREVTKGLPIHILKGSAFDIPFKDNNFDLVYTSGVLIHISPRQIKKALKEIVRVSKKYIWGLEYFAEKYQRVDYRGNKELLWKTNFAKLYQTTFPEIKLLKEKKLHYLESENIDSVFLLRKTNGSK